VQLRQTLAEPPPRLRAVVRWVTGLELAVGVVAVLLIFSLVLVQAGQRYLPFEGWSWTGELARFCLVWLTFAVAGVLVTSDSHIAIELVDGIRNPLVVRVVRVVACLVVAVIGAGLAVEAWVLVFDRPPIKSPALQMPMSWLYVPLLLGFASTTVRALVAALAYAVVGVPERDDDEDVAAAGGTATGRPEVPPA
jgi:TRAP-type C4-dicarboxylate transport system permease small subunit